jgi:hypothetical protein
MAFVGTVPFRLRLWDERICAMHAVRVVVRFPTPVFSHGKGQFHANDTVFNDAVRCIQA